MGLADGCNGAHGTPPLAALPTAGFINAILTPPFLDWQRSVFAFEVVVDRAIVMAVVLLVGLTWLLYKLVMFLEPRKSNGGDRQ